MKRSEMIEIIADWLSGDSSATGVTMPEDLKNADELLCLIEDHGMMPPKVKIGDYLAHDEYFWEEEKDSSVKEFEDGLDSLDIYLRRGTEIVGLHAVGFNEPHSYILEYENGKIETIQTNFRELQKWGNEYDENFNMIGRGSFRIFDISIENVAKEMELDGWVVVPKDFTHLNKKVFL
jgi:acyl carrier protein